MSVFDDPRPGAAPAAAAEGSRRPDPALLLPEALDLGAAAPLAAALAARRGHDVEVDASRVGRLGGQCLQVLLAARACWDAEGARLRVLAPSPAFADGLALLGASSLFPLPEAQEPT